MRPPEPGRAGRGAAVVLWLAALAAAQAAPAPPAGALLPFVAPDGSRFWLLPQADATQVHWAVATPADPALEPVGLEGLALAAARSALSGTWRTGSRDGEAEAKALRELDEAAAELLAGRATPAVQEQLQRAQTAAAALGDPLVFPRVLAAAPADRCEVLAAPPAAVLVLTTLPQALPEVARLLVERREAAALRDLPQQWLRELYERQQAFDRDPLAPLRAEAAALALPNHPASRAAERPATAVPRRAQALATWQQTQRPERSVHVLVGGFEPAAVQAVLAAAFAATALPPAGPPLPRPRPLAGQRRSTVPGTPQPCAVVGWLLPAGLDPAALATAARWLGDGADGALAAALRRRGVAGASVRCRAPWPEMAGGGSLFLVEVTAAAAAADQRPAALGELALAELAAAAASGPRAEDLPPVAAALQREWLAATADPRDLAVALARQALRAADRAPDPAPPTAVAPAAVRALLGALVATPAVVVEGRP